MKSISGKLVSVQPISLSKASRYISDFASFENNGASEVVSIYLNRASAAFSSLVQLQKDLKHPQSSRKKDRKKSYSAKENAAMLSNGETVNCDINHDENQGELDDKKDGVIEDMGTSKKRIKVMHKKENVKIEDGISSELSKGSDTGGNVEVDNMVNGFVDQPKKKKKKNENSRESVKEEVSVAGERRGVENGIEKGKKVKKRKENEIKDEQKEVEMEVEQGKKNRKKKKEEIQIKEIKGEEKLDVGQGRESKKKKRKSVDLDDELKENLV